MGRKLNRRDDPLVCSCNEVSRSTIQDAMRRGACSMAAIFDATWAGCGSCGGTCQPQIAALLQEFLARLEAVARSVDGDNQGRSE
jgi:bacterioferritin-associated ferredoxin